MGSNFHGLPVFKDFFRFYFSDGRVGHCSRCMQLFYSAGLIFADWQLTAKAVKIGPHKIKYFPAIYTVSINKQMRVTSFD